MKMNTRLRLPLLLGSAMMSTIAVPAFAADPAASAANDPAQQPAAQQPAADQAAAQPAETPGSATGLGDIVVTATKRETNLQKTPIAISVMSEQALEDRHIQSLINLADGSVPSLRVATFEARQSAITVGIRGIVPFDQNQTAREPGVGVYLDGVYLGRSQGLNAALFDLERVEVLKGPQGTLFGRNTEGGALSLVTRAPTGELGGSVTGGAGNYGSYEGQFHLNLPSFAGIALKVEGVIQNQDPTTDDPLAGSIGWNAYHRYGGRVAARIKPFDGFTADLSLDAAKDENTPFYSQLVNYNPKGLPIATIDTVNAKLVCPAGQTCIAPLPPLVGIHSTRQDVADVGVPQQWSVDKTSGASANLKWKVAPALELRSITAWRKVSTNQWDNSGGPERVQFAPNGKFSRYSLSDLYQSQFSQEFQAVGSVPQLDYVAGLYYFTEQARESAATPSSNQWNVDGTAYTILPAAVSGTITSGNQGWAYGSRFLQRASYAKAHSYAAFGQATYSPDFAEGLHLTVGGRYTKDKRTGTLYMVSGVATNWTLDYDQGRFDPLVVLAYDASRTVNLYAKYSTGFRAGGANDRSSNFQAFGPESVKSYEMGAKMDLLDHKLRVNLAGYLMDRSATQIDFDNVDTTQFLPGTSIPNPTFNLHTENTANAPGLSKIRGVEVDITARPASDVTLGLSYAYTYTSIPLTANPNPGPTFGVLTQVYTVYTPPNAVSGYVDYVTPVELAGGNVRLHLDANYADAQYSFQAESVKTDPSFIVNGSVALADLKMGGSKVTFTIWTRNLFDEAHIYRRSAANAAVLGDYANFNQPRTFGGQVNVKF
jgi:iron complex outermembrane receptor protein